MNRLLSHLALLLLCFAGPSRLALALEPDEILLLVNKNVPESLGLAHFYVNARRLPEGRILSLPLPINEEIAFANYETIVVPQVRQFLKDNNLDKKITCIVPMFGAPLRIGPHLLSDGEREEIEALKNGRDKLSADLLRELSDLEKKAQESDPKFQPQPGDDVNHIAVRAEAVFRAMAQRATQIPDPKLRLEQVKAMVETLRKFGGPAGVLRLFAAGGKTPEEAEQLKGLAEQMQRMADEVAQVQHQRWDPESRIRMRKLVADGFGKIELLRVMQLHIDYLEPADTVAAFDNELALLWWDYYPRTKWQPNMLHYRQTQRAGNAPPTLMVMRLDAPQAGQVRDMILAGLKAERDGLKGKLVLDSRGIMPKAEGPQEGGYGWYDQSIRNLVELVKNKSNLQVLHEDSPDLLPARSANDIALYCGWYSLRNYVPPGRFNLGAVGFHIASAEMISLKADGERGWCRGLLNDGVCATLGPVAEPYLHAFPPADEFFPLLLTGKLPLAEVYWKSNLLTSWMINMIGDPLYTPYRAKPALRVDDLPERLKVIFHPPSTQPTTQPTAR